MGAVNPSKTYCRELHMKIDDTKTDRVFHLMTIHGYRSVESLNAFFHGKKIEKDMKRNILWYEHNEYEHDFELSSSLSDWPKDDADYIQHEDIWAFYKYIGYDYKKKRWV